MRDEPPPSTGDDDCLRCRYDLRGLPDDAPCPECGLLAGRSRRRDAHLADASPGWLRGIAVGTSLVLFAHVAAVAWLLALPLWLANRQAILGVPIRPEQVAPLGFDLAAALLVAGVWLLARPQHASARDGRLRWALRAASLAPASALTIYHVVFAPSLSARPAWWATGAILLLLSVGLAPLPALLFALLRRLARRVLDANLAEHALIVGVGLSVTLASLSLLPWLASADALGRDAQLWIPLLGTVAVLLFGGWSALNCVRFAIAFGRAGRAARRSWRDADRAIAD